MTARRDRSGGYALFQVLVVIALLALALVVTVRVQSGLSRSVRALKDDARREVEARNLTARATFLLLTEPIGGRSIVVGGSRTVATTTPDMVDRNLASVNGVNLREVRLDGRPYVAGGGAALLAVQDEGGLFNLNAGDDPALSALLEGLGLGRPEARRLAAALNDYVDEDGLARQYGAEADAYRRAGLEGPSNRPLPRPAAFTRAIGWRAGLSGEQLAALQRLTSALQDVRSLNVNTAPPAVLDSVLGNPRTTRSFLARREIAPLNSPDDITAIAGVQTRADGLVLATKTGSSFRVLVAFGTSPDAVKSCIESQVTTTGIDADRPFYWKTVQRAGVRCRAWEDRDRGDGTERLPNSPALLAP